MEHLEIRTILDKGNVTDDGVRKLLYEAFDYDAILAGEEPMKAANIKEGSGPYGPLGDRNLAFAENRIQDFSLRFWDGFFPQLGGLQPTNAQKLAYLAVKLRGYGYFHEIPRALLDVVAPMFFEMYPDGEIWFVELADPTLQTIWADEGALQGSGTYGSPHEMSGLEGGVSAFIWLHLMTHFFYPFVNGFISTSDARRNFLFLPDRSMNTLTEYLFDLYRQTEFDLVSVYGDSIELFGSRGIKAGFPGQFAVLTEMRSYYNWYIDRCSALLDQLLSIDDVRRRYILNLTLNRIAVETEMIETSEVPHLMKVLFYGVLDKYANLYAQLDLEANEPEVWKAFLVKGFYETEIEEAMRSIPGRVGEMLSQGADWLYHHLEHDAPPPAVIREFRNSNHGYSIRNIDRLLQDPGELHNDVPSLATILWHWLLANGLPETPISQLNADL